MDSVAKISPADRNHAWRAELGATLTLAWPLILAQLTQMAIYSTDVLMLGRLGPEPLAASALAVNLFFMFNFTGMGLVTACAPLIAAALGERRNAVRDVRRSFRSAIHAGLLYAIPVLLILWNSHPILLLLGQDPLLSAQAARFMIILQWTLIPNLLIIIFRTLLTAVGKPEATLVVTVGGLFLNAILNWVLIFGNLGMPPLGLVGSAWASVCTTSFMAITLAVYVAVHSRTRRFYLFGRLYRPDFQRLAAIFRIGTPIAVTLAFEVSVFSVAIYLMGWIDTASVAAHAIAMQIASIAFMVPFGLSQATVIRVGLAYGAKDWRGVALAGWSSLAGAMGFMSLSAAAMWIFPSELASLFVDPANPDSARVLQLSVAFLGVAALFQLFDGAQVIGSAMLRGLQDTRVPMLFAAVGYWVVGLGSGYLLAFHGGLLGLGIWIGFALGLGVVAALMLTRWVLRDRLGLTRPAHA